jgi:branched-subunit amino acid transport protein
LVGREQEEERRLRAPAADRRSLHLRCYESLDSQASTPALWLAIVGAGAFTFAVRLSFIALSGRIEIPPFLAWALRFVPAAVLSAVMVPLLFYDDGALEGSLGNERLLAWLLAALIARRTRSVPLTLAGGMATLWTLQATGQSL